VPQQFNYNDDKGDKEKQDRQPVDKVHIPYPFGWRPVWVFFLYKEILRYLIPDSHSILLRINKDSKINE
jgi:hypothetical protein